MRKHEPVTLPSGVIRCMHCGSAWADVMGITCIDRPGVEPARGRRISALDDIDALNARVIELRQEQEALQDQLVSALPAACD